MRMRRARVRRVTRVSLSHSERDLVAQEEGAMHQVSYSSSVSTFCGNEMKDRNYKRKKVAPPPIFSLEISYSPPKS